MRTKYADGHLGYERAHTAVRESRGPAGGHSCISCGAPARHWAFQYRGACQHPGTNYKGPWSCDVRAYEPMCAACHRRYDCAQRVETNAARKRGEGVALPRTLVGIAETAARLRVHPATVRNMIARGELVAYRIGRSVRLDLADVDAALRPVATALEVNVHGR